MPRELINAKITHVSYVDKATNQKQFFFMKSEKQPDFQKEIKVIAKADDVQRLVYGIVYEPNVADAHGDFMTPEEIEKAAHGFLKDAKFFINVPSYFKFRSILSSLSITTSYFSLNFANISFCASICSLSLFSLSFVVLRT